MTDKPENPPAFASLSVNTRTGMVDLTAQMTLRDYFAAAALQALIPDGAIGMNHDCETAYAYADAMLLERSKNNA